MEAPPLEATVLHPYEMLMESSVSPRISLVIPSLSPSQLFGGVSTALDIFFQLGARTGADLRILMDDFHATADRQHLEVRARKAGIENLKLEVIRRTQQVPIIGVRRGDIFVTYNWWTTLNIRGLLRQQCAHFESTPKPHLYLVQEYEPAFYPMSSTHMAARLAFEPHWPCWGIFNSHELSEYFRLQGHQVERSFLFEPALSEDLRLQLGLPKPKKDRIILVYGRPSIARNCFPSVRSGLTEWARRSASAKGWRVVSAGQHHSPISLGNGCSMMSVGKLSMAEYGQLLMRTAVGVSLMASAHPSYPPLEMAHFGVRTLTNNYANKDLSRSHENIISLGDVAAETIADALTRICSEIEQFPDIGWSARSLRPSFLRQKPMEFLDALVQDLFDCVWTGS
jgi:hypothetical protein